MKQLRQQTYRVLRMLYNISGKQKSWSRLKKLIKYGNKLKYRPHVSKKSDNDVSFMYQLMQQLLLQYLLQSEHWFLANSNWDTTLIGSKNTL